MLRRNQPISKKILRSPFTLIVLFIILFILVKATWNIHKKALSSAERLRKTEVELANLEEDRLTLEAKVNHLGSAEGIESELRTKYRAVKEGEQVAVIVDKSNSAAVIFATSTPKLPWWKAWFNRSR